MSRPLAPSIVIGFDARPEAPGLARTVGQLLRQAGCHLVDIGVSSGPLTAFAVRHLAARAGVWISGADAPVGWSGLDLLTSSGGLPPAELLRQLVETAPASRPARGGGELETFDPIPAYQADLTRALREVRAVRSLLAAANPLTQVIGERVLSETACRVTWSAELQRGLPVPVVAEQTLQAELFAGISEDGRQLATADERGVRLLPQQLLAILADAHVSQRGTVRIAYDRHTWAPMVDAAPVCAATYIPVDSRFGETISARMSETTADLGLDRHGQVWQGGLAPVCDALQVLAGILSGLSVRTGSLSRWVGEAPERLQPAGGLA